MLLWENAMNYLQIRAFALGTPRTGYLNQVSGALTSISDLFGLPYDEQNSFFTARRVQNSDRNERYNSAFKF